MNCLLLNYLQHAMGWAICLFWAWMIPSYSWLTAEIWLFFWSFWARTAILSPITSALRALKMVQEGQMTILVSRSSIGYFLTVLQKFSLLIICSSTHCTFILLEFFWTELFRDYKMPLTIKILYEAWIIFFYTCILL